MKKLNWEGPRKRAAKLSQELYYNDTEAIGRTAVKQMIASTLQEQAEEIFALAVKIVRANVAVYHARGLGYEAAKDLASDVLESLIDSCRRVKEDRAPRCG